MPFAHFDTVHKDGGISGWYNLTFLRCALRVFVLQTGKNVAGSKWHILRHRHNICLVSSPVANQSLGGQDLLVNAASWTDSDMPQSVGLLWTSNQSDTGTSTWQRTTLTGERRPRPSGIRTRNSSKRAAADPCLRPRGHWDRSCVETL